MNASVEADNVRNMHGDVEDGEEEEEEAEGKRLMAVIMLQSAPLPFPQKMKFPGLSHYFSAIAWCGRSNLLACASETCARDPSSDQQPAFWIPVHLFVPERPSEHFLFNVTADSPNDWVQFLEWSPVPCAPALLVCTSNGRVTIWSQPMQGSSNVARTINCWSCEHEWREEQAATVKWVTGPSPYQFSASAVGALNPKSLEERFLAHGPRSTARWPNFLCICSILYSGSVQLHWRQWPLAQTNRPPKWFSTSKTVVGAGPSGLFAADAIVNTKGSLIVAGSPVGTPSTVIVWEICPWVVNSAGGSQPLKYGMPIQTQLSFGPPPWPGVAPLAAYLMSWQEHEGLNSKSGQSQTENRENGVGPLLQCSPISNLSAYVPPDASTLTTWGSGITSVAFDPSKGGSTLSVVVCEGYFISPERPDDGAELTGWRCQCWESASQPVAIHPLFEAASGTYPIASHSTAMSWIAVSNRVMPQGIPSRPTTGSLAQTEISGWKRANPFRPVNPRCISRIFFSGQGDFVLSFLSGEVFVYSGSSVTPSQSFLVPADRALPPALAFAPSSCCLALVWHSKKSDNTMLKFLRLDPPSSAASNQVSTLTWERHIADRFWWSVVNSLDWWEIVVTTQVALEDGLVTVPRVAAVLDADFHALPNTRQRQCYSKALDRLKCRLLEGSEAADNRALILDMQARLLLDMLGKGVEASLINPSSLVEEPWLASSETLSGLGPDAMAVDPPLVPLMQGYVDSILDLASHFLTRLRRYANFCRTLASHAVASPSSLGSTRPGVNLSNGGPLAAQGGQGGTVQSTSGNTTGTAGVQAWVQGAIAKINNSAETVTSSGSSTGISPATPLPLSVGSATFPGMPAVRLVGDCQFLHRLCQLLFFCLIFRKRQLPRFVAVPRTLPDSTSGGPKTAGVLAPKTEDMSGSSAGSRSTTGAPNVKAEDGNRVASSKPEEQANHRPARVGSGNAGQGYSSDAVKYLFLVLVDLCKRTAMHAHPTPKSQVGNESPAMRLHYVDGQYSVTPEVVEASLAPHMQQLPRPHGADAAGLLMRELELHPPAEEWNRKGFYFGSWSGAMQQVEDEDQAYGLWPRKRKYAERDAALGVRTAIGLTNFQSFMGARRDVITGVWKTSQHGLWHMCTRCGRKTASLAVPTLGTLPASSTPASQLSTSSHREAWWTGRWATSCPMCGGKWARVV